MICKTCKKSIWLFEDDAGGLYILEKVERGVMANHYCEAHADYGKILSKAKLLELDRVEG